jgi:hypothetical protein
MVNLGVAQIFIRQVAQAVHSIFHAERSAPHLAEHFDDLFGGQGMPP